MIKWPVMLLTDDGCDKGLLHVKSMMTLKHADVVHTEIELSKLDEELVKLLAWQRIQQLFPPKAPSTPQGSGLTAPPTTTVALKPQSPVPRTEGKTPPTSGSFILGS